MVVSAETTSSVHAEVTVVFPDTLAHVFLNTDSGGSLQSIRSAVSELEALEAATTTVSTAESTSSSQTTPPIDRSGESKVLTPESQAAIGVVLSLVIVVAVVLAVVLVRRQKKRLINIVPTGHEIVSRVSTNRPPSSAKSLARRQFSRQRRSPATARSSPSLKAQPQASTQPRGVLSDTLPTIGAAGASHTGPGASTATNDTKRILSQWKRKRSPFRAASNLVAPSQASKESLSPAVTTTEGKAVATGPFQRNRRAQRASSPSTSRRAWTNGTDRAIRTLAKGPGGPASSLSSQPVTTVAHGIGVGLTETISDDL